MKNKELEMKETKGRISLIKVMPYKGCQVYIRQIDEEIFEYLLVFNGQIYTSYIEVTLPKGRNKFNENELKNAAGLIFTGAVTTIDELLKMKVSEIATSPIKKEEVKRLVN